MDEKKGFEFEDISSSSKDTYEDIISDSRRTEIVTDNDFITLDELSAPRRYRKKKKGIAGFFSNMGYAISDWWRARKTWQKGLLISATAIVLVVAIIAGILLSTFDYNYNEITEKPEDLGVEEVIDDRIINVALFGLDTRDLNTFEGNSDSIMILSINTINKKVKIFSVMRDSLVAIEKNGKTTYSKINSAYAKGGPELAIKTLNKNFGLDITEYATVNFFGMVDIIDAVGGIEATITEDELYLEPTRSINSGIFEICKNKKINDKPHYIKTTGTQHLNGVQAVAYARVRYGKSIWGTNDDYGRTDRQRYVMEQLFNKALTIEKSRYLKLIKALIPCSETSLSASEIFTLATSVLLKSPSFEQYRIPQNSGNSNFVMRSPQGPFGSVVYYDLAYVTDVIHGIIYDDYTMETYIAEHGVRRNDWYTKMFGGSSGGSTSGGSSSQGGSSSELGGSSSDLGGGSSSDLGAGSSSETGGGSSSETGGASSEVGGGSSSETTGGSSSDLGGGSSSVIGGSSSEVGGTEETE